MCVQPLSGLVVYLLGQPQLDILHLSCYSELKNVENGHACGLRSFDRTDRSFSYLHGIEEKVYRTDKTNKKRVTKRVLQKNRETEKGEESIQ